MRSWVSPLGLIAMACATATALLLSFSAEAELSSEPKDGAAKVLKIDPNDPRPSTEEQNKRMHTIASKMVCLCGDCPRYNLGECQCGWAHTNRRVIELALMNGKTDEEIIEKFVEAYDLKVLDKLPNEGFARVSYLVPYAVALLLLGLTVWLGIRSRQKPKVETEPPSDTPAPVARAEAEEALRKELDDLY